MTKTLPHHPCGTIPVGAVNAPHLIEVAALYGGHYRECRECREWREWREWRGCCEWRGCREWRGGRERTPMGVAIDF